VIRRLAVLAEELAGAAVEQLGQAIIGHARKQGQRWRARKSGSRTARRPGGPLAG
jgi:hypothetical protein